MLKLGKIISLIAVMLLLTSCGITTSPHTSQISREKLASGYPTNVGWHPPKSDWQCQQIGQPQAYNWAGEQFKGNLKFGGGYAAIKEQALAYANEHHIDSDYIAIHVPTQVNVGGFNATALSKATVTYYRCQNASAI